MTEQPWVERADWPKCDWENGPFETNTKVEFRFNDGTVDSGESIHAYWFDEGEDCTIAAYRRVDPS